jgi:hypothetical protein
MGIFGPIVVKSLLNSTIKSQVVMTESNHHLWGLVPGDTGMVMFRNFTFFNFTNPLDFMLYNKTPEFIMDG